MKILLQLFIKFRNLFSVSLLALIACLDLLNYGIPPTHDGEYHVMRFQQFYKVLSEGSIYTRWAPDFNNGFGIPLFNFVYPLPNYVASFFHFLGFGFIDSFKLNMVVASIVGAMFMYIWAKKYWGEWGGVVSSAFYTFSPYHLLDIYVRGSVGEVWSLAIIPGLLWAYYSYFETKRKIFFILSSILLAFLIYAHNILAIVFFSFFILYALFLILNSKKKKLLFLYTLQIILIGLGLSSPFWLPALLETKYVVGLQVFDPSQHFPIIYKLIYSSWGYGFSGSNASDQMSFQIGIANLLVFGASCALLLKIKQKMEKKIALFIIFMFAITLFLITPFSELIWKTVPFMSYIQFPWRLLSLIILLSSFLAGFLVFDKLFKEKPKVQIVIAIALISLSIGYSLRYAKAPFYHKRADSHYLTRSNFTDGTNSPGNSFNTKWMRTVPDKENKKIELVSGLGKINIGELKSTSYKFMVESEKDAKVRINTAYFPGWVAMVNDKQMALVQKNGSMELNLNSGSKKVHINLNSTPIQTFSYILFLLSVLMLIIIYKRNIAIINK